MAESGSGGDVQSVRTTVGKESDGRTSKSAGNELNSSSVSTEGTDAEKRLEQLQVDCDLHVGRTEEVFHSALRQVQVEMAEIKANFTAQLRVIGDGEIERVNKAIVRGESVGQQSMLNQSQVDKETPVILGHPLPLDLKMRSQVSQPEMSTSETQSDGEGSESVVTVVNISSRSEESSASDTSVGSDVQKLLEQLQIEYGIRCEQIISSAVRETQSVIETEMNKLQTVVIAELKMLRDLHVKIIKEAIAREESVGQQPKLHSLGDVNKPTAGGEGSRILQLVGIEGWRNPSRKAESDAVELLKELYPVGTRVEVDTISKGQLSGTVMFAGTTEFGDGMWIGVALDEPKGNHNGTYKGVEYFICKEDCGMLVRPTRVGWRKPSEDVDDDKMSSGVEEVQIASTKSSEDDEVKVVGVKKPNRSGEGVLAIEC